MNFNGQTPWSPPGRVAPWETSSPASHATNAAAAAPTSPSAASHDPEAFFHQFSCVQRALETWHKSQKPSPDPRFHNLPPHLSHTQSHSQPYPQPHPQSHHRYPPEYVSHATSPMISASPVPHAHYGPPRPINGHPYGHLTHFPQASGHNFLQAAQQLLVGGQLLNDHDPASRRMAAQRERELRNFHQEQQMQKHHTPSNKSDRSLSPNAPGFSEEDRRDLLARQHRALYPDSPSAAILYTDSNRQSQPPAPVSTSTITVTAPTTTNSTSAQTPASFVNQQQQTHPTSTGPSSSILITQPAGSVGPIGTRPTQQLNQTSQAQQNTGSRSGTPGNQLKSTLSFAFHANSTTPSEGEGRNDNGETSLDQNEKIQQQKIQLQQQSAMRWNGWGGAKNGLSSGPPKWG